MTTQTLYFDESGFTGYNLLDADQPIFAIASTSICDNLAEEVLKTSFPHYKGTEYKFTNIWKSNNRGAFVEFGRRLGDMPERVFSWIMHKQFVVLAKVVDFLIEPHITDAGYDFYSDGFCWKYANYIHYGLSEFSPALYDALVVSYQRLSRDPTNQGLSDLQAHLGIMANSVENPPQVFLEQMALGAEMFLHYSSLETFKRSNELQLSGMLASVIHWRQRNSEEFHIIHDCSSNFFRQRNTWERVTNSDVPKQPVTIGDGTAVEFPLRVTSTTAVDSKSSFAVQLCDLLAGLSARRFNSSVSDQDRKLLGEVFVAGLGEIPYNGVYPGTEFPDQIPPKRLTGPDVVDQVTNILFEDHNDSRPQHRSDL